MENPPRKYFSPMVIWALIVFALVMLAIILAGYGYRSYRHTEDAERDKLIRLADQASIQMAQEMDAIDSVLERAIAQVTEARRSRQAEDSDRFFSQLTASNTAISSLVAVDTDGVIFASSRASLKGNVFFNSERYKLISQHPDAKTLYVSTPFITPLGKRAFTLGRMLPDDKGGFHGYILAVLSSTFFSNTVHRLTVAPEANMALIHPDGPVIYRVPDSNKVVGMDFRAYPGALFWRFVNGQETKTFASTVVASTGIDSLGVLERIQPQQAHPDKSLVFAIARSRVTVFANLYRSLWACVVGWLVSAAVLVYIGTRMTRAEVQAK